MPAAITHPMIPPVDRETVKYNTTGYTQRLYHTSTLIHEAAQYARKKEIPRETGLALADAHVQIQESRDLIEMHFDQRIHLFFIHCITCWHTPFEYHIEGANEQFGQGGNTVKIEGGGKIPCKTRAAHSSTLPGLLFRKRGSKDLWSVYLKGSHTSNLHNATIEFHTCLNEADSLIDGTAAEKDKLRGPSIDIINKVAQGALKPIAAMHRFMQLAVRVIENKSAGEEERAPKRAILEVYLERAQALWNAMDDDLYFDRLLTVQIAGDLQEESLRKAVYTIRFKLIKDTQLIETEIAQAILATHKMICPKSKTKSLAKIHADLRFHLLHKSTNTLQKALERFLGTSHEQLDPGYDLRDKKTKEIKREAFYEKHKEKIQRLFRDLRSLFYQIHRAEALSWSEAIRSIRHVRGWSQNQTATIHRTLYPHIPMSRSTYCRLEGSARPDTKVVYQTPESQRKKPVSHQTAQTLSTVFKVDQGLLLASLCGSRYC